MMPIVGPEMFICRAITESKREAREKKIAEIAEKKRLAREKRAREIAYQNAKEFSIRFPPAPASQQRKAKVRGHLSLCSTVTRLV